MQRMLLIHATLVMVLLAPCLLSSMALAAPRPVPADVSAPSSSMPGAPIPSISTAAATDYTLDTGDKLRVTVFGEPDLSGEFEVDSQGRVSLPLIGEMDAKTKTVGDFTRTLQAKLSEGYLKDPRVSIEVLNYRPFFILGEVAKPGSYPYVNGMTVVNAVALAGGYTYRADKDDITVVRGGDAAKKEDKIAEDGTVKPGDILRVPERFF